MYYCKIVLYGFISLNSFFFVEYVFKSLDLVSSRRSLRFYYSREISGFLRYAYKVAKSLSRSEFILVTIIIIMISK